MKEDKTLLKIIYSLVAILLITLLIRFTLDSFLSVKKDQMVHKAYEKQSTYVDSIHVLNSKIFWLEDSINYLNQEIEYYEYVKQ